MLLLLSFDDGSEPVVTVVRGRPGRWPIPIERPEDEFVYLLLDFL